MKTSGVVERMEVRPESLFYHEHVARYQFAQTHIQSGLTLDIACGTGYGTNLLIQQVEVQVVGADLYLPALREARKEYPSSRILFMAGDGTRLPFESGRFQNIVSLETLEHIEDDRGYLRELSRILRSDGVCVLSTPNRLYSLSHQIVNPYHVREYVEDELLALLRPFFSQVIIFYQGFVAGYHAQVHDYAAAIQTRKRDLNPLIQVGINRIYRPLKQLVPASITNFFVRRILGLSYPQPAQSHITIADKPLTDTSVLVAVCRL